MPKHLKIILGVILVVIAYSFTVKPLIEVHNTNLTYQTTYNKLTEEQYTNFEGYYLMFQQKYDIADINKETFLIATDIIMSARQDGENVSWKWLQENQQIDMETFSKFYANLSTFVEERYQDNMKIERQKQETVRQQNLYLDSFPNNIYNKALNKEKLIYKKGVIDLDIRK